MVCNTRSPLGGVSPTWFKTQGVSVSALVLPEPVLSFGVERERLQLGAAAAAPAARRDAHAALRRPRAVAVGPLQPLPLQPLAVRLALRALGPVVEVARRGAGGRLGGDGAQQVVPFPQEVAVGAQAEASLTQDHPRAAGLGGPRAVVVLQLGQMGRVPLCDELWRRGKFELKGKLTE